MGGHYLQASGEVVEAVTGAFRYDLETVSLFELPQLQEGVVELAEEEAELEEGHFAVGEKLQEVLSQICLVEWPESLRCWTSIKMSELCPLVLNSSLTSNSAHPTKYG